MKINVLDAHDRFLAFQNYQTDVGKFIQEMIDSRPYGNRSFYIFIIHKRSLGLDEQQNLVINGVYKKIEDTPEAWMILSARLSKPEAVPNTTLIKVTPGKDVMRQIWSLPQIELFDEFEKILMFENEFITSSIYQYKHNKKKLEELEGDDPQSLHEFQVLCNRAKNKKIGQRIPIYRPREVAPPELQQV